MRRRPLLDRSGAEAGQVLLLRDISDRRAAEEQVRLLLAERTRVAASLQTALLPAVLPRVPGLVAAALYRPAGEGREIGGDFYELFALDGSRWCAVLGDVAGKGAEAAAVTARVRFTVRALAGSADGTEELLRSVNQVLGADGDDERFCTLAHVVLEPHPRGVRAEVVLAGHLQPLLRRAGGLVETVGVPGTALGLVPEPDLVAHEVDLGPGDALCLFTDGLVEARDARGTELGAGRVGDVLASTDLAGPDGPRQTLLALERAAELLARRASGGRPGRAAAGRRAGRGRGGPGLVRPDDRDAPGAPGAGMISAGGGTIPRGAGLPRTAPPAPDTALPRTDVNPSADAPALDTSLDPALDPDLDADLDPALDPALDASGGAPLAAPALGGPAVPPDTEDAGSRPPRMARTALVLGAFVAIGPLTIDMYLPALPTIATELETTEAAVQLTLTGTLVGLALGQLVIGPLSDALGRRAPLLAGTALHVVASLLILLAPSIEVLGALRVLQGVGTAAGAVVALAVVRDLYDGRAAATMLSRLFLVMGAAPVLAPTIGGGVLTVTSWRGVFALLALYGVGLLVGGWFLLRETLPRSARRASGPRATLRTYGGLFHDRAYVGLVVVAGLTMAALFSYVAGSSFVYQGQFGLDEQEFGLLFGAGAFWLIAATQLNPRVPAPLLPGPGAAGGHRRRARGRRRPAGAGPDRGRRHRRRRRPAVGGALRHRPRAAQRPGAGAVPPRRGGRRRGGPARGGPVRDRRRGLAAGRRARQRRGRHGRGRPRRPDARHARARHRRAALAAARPGRRPGTRRRPLTAADRRSPRPPPLPWRGAVSSGAVLDGGAARRSAGGQGWVASCWVAPEHRVPRSPWPPSWLRSVCSPSRCCSSSGRWGPAPRRAPAGPGASPVPSGTAGSSGPAPAPGLTGEAVPPVRLVNLGDSFSAAVGTGGVAPVPPLGCLHGPGPDHVSELVRREQAVLLLDAACAGATTADVRAVLAEPAVAAALAEADLVTLTLGGNDVGWTDYLRACSTAGEQEAPGACDRLLAEVDARVAAAGDSARRTLADLAAATDARVVVLGYPHLVDAAAGTPFVSDARAVALAGATDRLNAAVGAGRDGRGRRARRRDGPVRGPRRRVRGPVGRARPRRPRPAGHPAPHHPGLPGGVLPGGGRRRRARPARPRLTCDLAPAGGWLRRARPARLPW